MDTVELFKERYPVLFTETAKALGVTDEYIAEAYRTGSFDEIYPKIESKYNELISTVPKLRRENPLLNDPSISDDRIAAMGYLGKIDEVVTLKRIEIERESPKLGQYFTKLPPEIQATIGGRAGDAATLSSVSESFRGATSVFKTSREYWKSRVEDRLGVNPLPDPGFNWKKIYDWLDKVGYNKGMDLGPVVMKVPPSLQSFPPDSRVRYAELYFLAIENDIEFVQLLELINPTILEDMVRTNESYPKALYNIAVSSHSHDIARHILRKLDKIQVKIESLSKGRLSLMLHFGDPELVEITERLCGAESIKKRLTVKSVVGSNDLKFLEYMISRGYVTEEKMIKFIKEKAILEKLETIKYDIENRKDIDAVMTFVIRFADTKGLKLKLTNKRPDTNKMVRLAEEQALTGCPSLFLYTAKTYGLDAKNHAKRILSRMSIDLFISNDIEAIRKHESEYETNTWWFAKRERDTLMIKKEVLKHLDETHPVLINLNKVVGMLIPFVSKQDLQLMVEDHMIMGNILIARMISNYL